MEDFLEYVSLVASLLALAFGWRAWVKASDTREDLDALRYTLRRELGSDGL